MISVWGKFIPGSAENPNDEFGDDGCRGYLYPGLGGSAERYYDAFNPDARRQYWELMRDQIFKLGVDAWWLDASEPEVSMHDFRTTPTAAGLGAQVLNGWPLMHTTTGGGGGGGHTHTHTHTPLKKKKKKNGVFEWSRLLSPAEEEAW